MESVHPNSSGQTAQDYQGFLAPRPDFGRTGVSDQRAWPPQAVNKISSFLPWFHYFLKLSFTLFIFLTIFVLSVGAWVPQCACVKVTLRVLGAGSLLTRWVSEIKPHHQTGQQHWGCISVPSHLMGGAVSWVWARLLLQVQHSSRCLTSSGHFKVCWGICPS